MNKRITAVTAIAVVITVITFLFSLKCGVWETSWHDVQMIFTDPENFPAFILRQLRLPRTLLAMLSGAALAVSGTILQKVLRNDLASPDILGVSGGAGCAGLALLIFFPGFSHYLNAATFAGAIFAAFLIALAAWKRTLSPVRLILAGVALGALFSTVSGAMISLNPEKISGVMEFALGGFSRCTMSHLSTSLPFFSAALLLAPLLAARMDVLALGKEEATALGLPVERNRIMALALAALAAATAVSVAGLLGFAGLIAPHIAGKLLNTRRAMPLLILSALTGAEITLAADLAGRMLFMPRELPCGLFLSAFGALFFLFLLLKEKEGEL
ncbi:MAG: iron ABC transporter permease [Lentisphaeria bacterium]|nr:iron ABC transporter permease [Lentisphaeria bacterium]